MKKRILLLLVFGVSIAGYSQMLPGNEFRMMVKQAREEIQGAHESVVRSINEEFATSIWRKEIRLYEADIIRFFKHPGGEKISAGVDLTNLTKNSWVYEFDQQATSDLLKEKGVQVTTSFNTLWIKANQNLVYIEHTEDGLKSALELYCPTQEVLAKLRTGKQQTIEFLITGYRGSASGNDNISGILTQVQTEKQVVTCTNGHEFDKAQGYEFCPKCGESLE